MGIIEKGEIIRSNRAGGEATTRFALDGAPAGGDFEGQIREGELVENVTTGDLYKCTGEGPTTFVLLDPTV
jgi:hypothetical protein